MKPEFDNEELTALMEELSIDAEQARAMLREIEAGEKQLSAGDELKLPDGMLERIAKAWEPPRQKPAFRFAWFYRVAAGIVFAWVAFSIYQIARQPAVQPPSPSAVAEADDIYGEEVDLWEVALAQEDEIDLDADESAMTEILLLWEDAGWEADTLFDKETYDEDNGFSAFRNRGARLV